MTLSAMADDEAGDVGIRRVLTHSDKAGVRALWRRHCLVKAALGHPNKPFVKISDDFLGKVQATISQSASERPVTLSKEPEPAVQPLSEKAESLGRLLKLPLWQPLAVAASVAMVAVFAVNFTRGGAFSGVTDTGYATAPEAAVLENTQTPNASRRALAADDLSNRPANTRFVRYRLNAYALRHVSNSDAVSTRFMPFVKMASNSDRDVASQQEGVKPVSDETVR